MVYVQVKFLYTNPKILHHCHIYKFYLNAIFNTSSACTYICELLTYQTVHLLHFYPLFFNAHLSMHRKSILLGITIKPKATEYFYMAAIWYPAL
jgi:hypothetical protein